MTQSKIKRNPGTELNLDWINNIQANTSATERRAATLGARRSIKKDHQAAWLIKAQSDRFNHAGR